jgi:hypothetical protein
MRGDEYLPYELLGYQKICNLKLSNQKYSFAQEYQFHVMICQRVFMRKEKKKETRAESTLEISDFLGLVIKLSIGSATMRSNVIRKFKSFIWL